jgi:sterol desaturase/sphingolipid hydroxylase (fatty acid hydroxylase superfamily)
MTPRESATRFGKYLVVLSRAEYYADFFITPPLTALLLVYGVMHAATSWWPLQVLFGWALWTAYEYCLHRWVLHHAWVISDLHDIHHADEQAYIALHPICTLLAYAVTWAVFGAHASMIGVGFTIGYVWYAMLHTLFHHAHISVGHVLYRTWRRHVLHHRDERTCFGITTSLWDRLGGTEHPLAIRRSS